MKKVFFISAMALNLTGFSQATWNTAAPGPANSAYIGGQVGVGLPNGQTATQSLDLWGNISVRGTHVVFNSEYGVIDWGAGTTGDLLFRTLYTQGNINTYTERMKITNDGKVGIGSFGSGGAVNYKLDVAGSVRASTHLDIGGSNLNALIPLHITQSGDVNAQGIKFSGNSLGKPALEIFEGVSSSYSRFKTFVSGHTYIGQFSSPAYNVAGSMLTVGQSNSTYKALNVVNTANPSSPVDLFTIWGNGNVGVNTTSSPPAKLTVNGNVLIGDPSAVTNLPFGYKLYVQTGIITEKVKVQLVQWADYVFEKNYKLKSLDEVQIFIEKNKHLPGVPSASELQSQGGLDVAQMDAKLMEKIEELTLYILQLNEKNKELTERISELEIKK